MRSRWSAASTDTGNIASWNDSVAPGTARRSLVRIPKKFYWTNAVHNTCCTRTALMVK